MTKRNQNETKGLSVDARGIDMDQTPFQNRSQPSFGLVNAPTLLKEIWIDEASRPSLRWLRAMQAKRIFPFVRIGRKIFFSVEEVRRAIDAQFKVESQG